MSVTAFWQKSSNFKRVYAQIQDGASNFIDIFALSSRKGYTGENKQNILREQLNP